MKRTERVKVWYSEQTVVLDGDTIKATMKLPSGKLYDLYSGHIIEAELCLSIDTGEVET